MVQWCNTPVSATVKRRQPTAASCLQLLGRGCILHRLKSVPFLAPGAALDPLKHLLCQGCHFCCCQLLAPLQLLARAAQVAAESLAPSRPLAALFLLRRRWCCCCCCRRQCCPEHHCCCHQCGFQLAAQPPKPEGRPAQQLPAAWRPLARLMPPPAAAWPRWRRAARQKLLLPLQQPAPSAACASRRLAGCCQTASAYAGGG